MPFSRLYEALHPEVLAAVNRVLPDQARCEEVAQEAVFEMWLTAERYRADLGVYEDRTHQQMATQLGIPPGTAKSRIRDALIRLRRELDR